MGEELDNFLFWSSDGEWVSFEMTWGEYFALLDDEYPLD